MGKKYLEENTRAKTALKVIGFITLPLGIILLISGITISAGNHSSSSPRLLSF
jgi:hypothetical protein